MCWQWELSFDSYLRAEFTQLRLQSLINFLQCFFLLIKPLSVRSLLPEVFLIYLDLQSSGTVCELQQGHFVVWLLSKHCPSRRVNSKGIPALYSPPNKSFPGLFLWLTQSWNRNWKLKQSPGPVFVQPCTPKADWQIPVSNIMNEIANTSIHLFKGLAVGGQTFYKHFLGCLFSYGHF